LYNNKNPGYGFFKKSGLVWEIGFPLFVLSLRGGLMSAPRQKHSRASAAISALPAELYIEIALSVINHIGFMTSSQRQEAEMTMKNWVPAFLCRSRISGSLEKKNPYLFPVSTRTGLDTRAKL
jgi:hypothetical protein